MTKELTARHKLYRKMLENSYPVVCTGSQGTGKTYGAVEEAMRRLRNREVHKIICTRPNQGPGETLGFLPGTLDEKLAPWIRPMRDLFMNFVKHRGELEDMERHGVIEYIAFEHIQGLTFDNAVVILDECELIDYSSLQIFLGREGHNSKTILCGDTKQVGSCKTSGLKELVDMIRYTDADINIIELKASLDPSDNDCLRSQACTKRILEFEKWAEHKEAMRRAEQSARRAAVPINPIAPLEQLLDTTPQKTKFSLKSLFSFK